ncbi:hypothetical protein Val02_29590 [Virgisporangium aliadipatigenens]|uniref:PAC domain-containing protein n=1 Tax=Virgisporangium aliadipatigenens TaxID=741659 RepID=A0A8J3YLQ7_9ACTN|nr:PAS domain-containing protein [Virgisporangium aliadipatigenens]GIJ46073.1 hypothetical protein Val02_29590 [Virgisporangium aliadipatigenens]
MGRPDPRRSRAVIIGMSRFDSADLPDHPVIENNVVDLAETLTSAIDAPFLADHCASFVDETDMAALGRSIKAAADTAEDLLLVYYSGHGCLDPRRHDLYLALPGTDPDNLGFTAIPASVLNEAIRNSPADNKVLILDCCFSGRLETGRLGGQESFVRGGLGVAGRFTLTSATGNQASVVLPGERHSAFTGRLLDLLRHGVPGGPAELTLEYIHRRLETVMAREGLPRPECFGQGTAAQLVLATNRAAPTVIGAPGTPDPNTLQPVLDPLWSERPEALYRDAPCGFLTTLPDYSIIHANDTFLDWMGYSRKELTDRYLTDLLNIGGRVYFDTHLTPLLKMQGKITEIALEMLRSDGTRMPVLANLSLVRDPSGDPRFCRVIIFDATNRRAYERELLAARRQAERALQELKEQIRSP